ncbi:hypothetical protein PV783_11675 [Chitinophaga sp. CC14]|uniref:hypothetical protein n=1 Tax=Chitinophaga sp. CC14 TaxID=3029199 RepID=UPI003B7C460D
MEREFRVFKIPQAWKKYIWGGIIGVLLYFLKLSEQERKAMQKDLKDCYKGRLMDKVMDSDIKRKADSIMIQRLMDRAIEDADRRIIQPKIDSIKNSQL